MLAHMFSVSRQRRETERKERLEDLFRKADEQQEGRLTVEQVFHGTDMQHVNYARVHFVHSYFRTLFSLPFFYSTKFQVTRIFEDQDANRKLTPVTKMSSLVFNTLLSLSNLRKYAFNG